MEQYHSKYLIIATDIVCYDCLFIACHRLFQGPFLFFHSFLIIPVIVLQRRSYFFGNCVPVNAFFSPSGDGPYRFPKRVLHRMRSSASSFNFLYHIFSLRSSSSCLRRLPRFPSLSSFLLSFLQ